jgi:hypothetical protein
MHPAPRTPRFRFFDRYFRRILAIWHHETADLVPQCKLASRVNSFKIAHWRIPTCVLAFFNERRASEEKSPNLATFPRLRLGSASRRFLFLDTQNSGIAREAA